jgi:protein-disulfide isomerase
VPFPISLLKQIPLGNLEVFIIRAKLEMGFLLVSASIMFAIAAGVLRNSSQTQRLKLPSTSLKLLDIDSAIAVGPSPIYRGPTKSGYTIVIFLDYQCPYCREAEPVLRELSGNRAKLVVRNLPLRKIHKLAARAAGVVSRAATDSEHWSLHDSLISAPLTDARLSQLEANSKLLPANDPLVVSRRLRDLADAEILGITKTPTFVVITPEKKVFKFLSILELKQHFDWNLL